MNLMIILFNLLFLNSKNPLMMGLILILQTMMISLILGKMNLTFWMSFIIFLIFIGGMLILFMYVISMLNNNFLKIKKMMTLFFFMLFLMPFFLIFSYNINYETLIFNNFLHMTNEISMNLLKMYNIPNMIIMMMIIIYLFIMMIVTTKITNYFIGPFYKF